MCLHSVTKSIFPPTDKEVTVYKIFEVEYNRHSRHYRLTGPHYFDPKLITGRWLKATQGYISSSYGNSYSHGFHGYKKRVKISNTYEIVLPVKFRKVHTHGRQDHDDKLQDVLVAHEMFIPVDWLDYVSDEVKKSARETS